MALRADQLVDALRAAGEPTRLRILALLAREETRILSEIQTAFEGTELSDPESTLIEGYTGFLRAVASSPDVYRLIFLGEGGGNAAVARRIQRGREAQIDVEGERVAAASATKLGLDRELSHARGSGGWRHRAW